MDIKCIYISVLLMFADGFTVRGASGPLAAPLGSSVVLSCSLDELLLIEGRRAEWRKTHLTPEQVSWKKTDEDEDILVLLYQNNQALPDLSDEQYRDRVEFFTAEIPKGNFSLRLKSVRTEDKGVYTCQVFAGELSANATVVLKTLGFSSLHIMVLVFCFAAGSGAVLLLCCLIYCRSTNTVSSSTIWSLQLSLVFCPNVFMSFAFIFWALTEGFLYETITCCTLYILRPVMLIWALPCLNYLLAFLAVAFFTQVLLIYIPFIPLVKAKLNSLCRRWITLLWITTLLHIVLQIYFHLDILQKEREYVEWTCVISFLEVLRMMVVFENSVPGQRQRHQTETNQQGSNASHLCNEIMYMFGAVGLVLLSSVTLTAVLILKARNGERVLKDLRFIVFPAEGVFALYWLILQMHAYWKIVTTENLDAQRCSHQKDQLKNSPETEMENLSAVCLM